MGALHEDPRSISIKTLAHTLELGAQILQKTAGNDVANSLGGVQLTPNAIKDALAARLLSQLSTHPGSV